ncbi:hypothetical protein B0H17DRAFT_1123652 [Mycena rosella]|uniref:Uncharacterized protein n=1 Tax=Mycena rosella TaxID=1033263 RepID=A0AAD7MCI5_MYCRO|nr:hypothetical protein B0H17DRAFT_1123652 [Mycena rosella]
MTTWHACASRKTSTYTIKDPGGFRVGDVVEMGFALVAFNLCPTSELIQGQDCQRRDACPKSGSRQARQNPVVKKQFELYEMSSDDEDYPETKKHMAMLKMEEDGRHVSKCRRRRGSD